MEISALTSCLTHRAQLLFSAYGFTFPLTVALLQVLCTIPAAFFSMEEKLAWATAGKCLPLAIVHTLNMTAALAGRK